MATDHLNVSELFYSIQGESTFAGTPCVFIRLAGCNLRCSYCDARYTYTEAAEKRPLKDIINFVHTYPGALVEVTGGEPLLQDQTIPLLESISALGRTVLLETNGSIDTSNVPLKVIKIIDLKCPDSGMHEKMLFDNFRNAGPNDEIKCVLSSRKDYDWAVQTLIKEDFLTSSGQRGVRKSKILFSPVPEKLDASKLADWMMTDKIQVQLQLQLHKILWPSESRGV